MTLFYFLANTIDFIFHYYKYANVHVFPDITLTVRQLPKHPKLAYCLYIKQTKRFNPQ